MPLMSSSFFGPRLEPVSLFRVDATSPPSRTAIVAILTNWLSSIQFETLGYGKRQANDIDVDDPGPSGLIRLDVTQANMPPGECFPKHAGRCQTPKFRVRQRNAAST